MLSVQFQSSMCEGTLLDSQTGWPDPSFNQPHSPNAFQSSLCEGTVPETEWSDQSPAQPHTPHADFFCESTRIEMLAGYPDGTSNQPRKHLPLDNGSHDTAQDATQMETSQNFDFIFEIPWQNIANQQAEHWDPYQKFTLDTRFVPEQYRELVDTLQRVDSLQELDAADEGRLKELLPVSRLPRESRRTRTLEFRPSKETAYENASDQFEHGGNIAEHTTAYEDEDINLENANSSSRAWAFLHTVFVVICVAAAGAILCKRFRADNQSSS